MREAYDAFLAEYPLCFGYWKKLAEAEARLGGGAERVGEVYERGCSAAAYSVDMWAAYLAHAAASGGPQEEVER